MDQNNLSEKLQEALSSRDINKAKDIAKKLPFKELCDVLVSLAFETKSIFIYTFISALLADDDTVEYNIIASQLLALPLSFIAGAEAAAYYHALKCVELDPETIENKEYLLFFYGFPDAILGKKEALEIAQEVIKVKPDSTMAQDIIKELMLKKF